MHCDEAVGAVKFGRLLEEGHYQYNPHQYHGPTLNYLSLVPAWLTGAGKLVEVSESALRMVPVFFGIVLVLMVFFLADGLGKLAVTCAAILTTVFYSRYYIHEMLLVCFTFAVIVCVWRYIQSKNIIWVILAGMFLGLSHATKETFIIVLGSMLAAGLAVLVMRRQGGSASNTAKAIKPLHIFAAVAAAAIVSVLFHSSFFTNSAGVLDSVRAYIPYFTRAGGDGLHRHPWYYYLRMLLWWQYADGPIWSEAFIVLLACVGFFTAMRRKPTAGVNPHLLAFIGFYTVVMTVVYSVIPYKTPWCVLGFLNGMILLAGVGAGVLIKAAPTIRWRVVVGLLLIVGAGHLAWQAYLGSYKFYADSRNPYVYAHPTEDVVTIAQRVRQLAKVHPDGSDMYIQVICPDDDYWPLPWYLRSLANVGWFNRVDEDVPAASVIIASPTVEQALLKRLYELPPPGQRQLYVPLFDGYMQLRPQVELLGFVSKDLWDRYQQIRTK
jgi:uncharacterized protein (TIGR03663 family)